MGKVKIPDVHAKPDNTWVGRHVDINGHFIVNQKGGYIVVSVAPIKKRAGGRVKKLIVTGWALTIKLANGTTKTINLPSTSTTRDGDPNVQIWLDKLKKNQQHANDPAPTPPSNPIITITDVVKGKAGKFNPPPHRSSRPTSPMLFPTNMGGHASNIRETNSRIANAEKFNNRGFIYEDIDTAQDKYHQPKTRKNLWGFEFMYNPETISHSLILNGNIDYTNNLDVANQLSGSQIFSLTIRINRVGDMNALHKKTSAGTSEGYPRPLTAAEIKGIQTRGTEYDLEFLYRVVNGDPTDLPGKSAYSSDFGFISGIPIWIRLNNQMRYKALLQGISVNHTMFTPSMIPTMTQVDLQFYRIPVISYGDTAGDISKRYLGPDGKTSRVPKYQTGDTPTNGGAT